MDRYELKKYVKQLVEEELNKPVVVKYKKLDPDAMIRKKRDEDTCWDVRATSRTNGVSYIEYGTGLAFDIPEGYDIRAYARSSVSNTPFILANSIGIIDQPYKGELMVRFKALRNYVQRQYEPGDFIIQIEVFKKTNAKLEQTDDVGTSDRGSDGFGSTDRK